MTAKLALSVLILLAGASPPPAMSGAALVDDDPALVRITDATVAYRATGEYSIDARSVDGPRAPARAAKPFSIMRRQVTRGDYDRCVAASACRKLGTPGNPALPVVGVSWHDATAYAGWRTATSGRSWRLPTDIEWAIAAGSRYRDDALSDDRGAGDDPSRRWLADYDGASRDRRARDATVRPAGYFGRNEHGLDDLAGNVWEWTSTCFTRHRSDTASGQTSAIENCGVRVVEGLHRAYLQAFFRDPKGGACSVGVPPIHLGLRLVRDDGSSRRQTPMSEAEQLLAGIK